MRLVREPNLCGPGIAFGVISGFPLHGSYPVEDREALDKLFREDYFAWETMAMAAERYRAISDGRKTLLLYCIDGWWQYKDRHIVDRGFVLIGNGRTLRGFMEGYQRPYILKTESDDESVSFFSDQNERTETIFVGDLNTGTEILRRVYSYLRAGTIFGEYTLASFGASVPQTSLDIMYDFLSHIRQNGEIAPVWHDTIPINDERALREIKLLDHPRLKDSGTSNRLTLARVLTLLDAPPEAPPILIRPAEAAEHLRKHVRVQGVVTEIETNRRGDWLLRFGPTAFQAVIPIMNALSREQEWISSLKNKTIIVQGLMSFYAQEPAMRILEKDQVSFPGQTAKESDL
jgi:hypothetical protein